MIADNTLYFKVDESTKKDYEESGMEAFKPYGEDSYSMGYYTVPEEVMENDQLIREWGGKALAIARLKGKKK